MKSIARSLSTLGRWTRGVGARRSFATQAEGSGKSSTDVTNMFFGVPGRYAGALYRAAVQSGQITQVNADIQAIQNLRKTSKRLDSFLADPTLSRELKRDAVQRALQAAGISTDLVRNWMTLLSDNGRLGLAGKIMDTFDAMTAAQRGTVEAIVTSATPLSDWQLGLLQERLRMRFFPDVEDARVDLVVRTDQSLLGGLTIQLGDKFMDLSVASEVKRLKETIMRQN